MRPAPLVGGVEQLLLQVLLDPGDTSCPCLRRLDVRIHGIRSARLVRRSGALLLIIPLHQSELGRPLPVLGDAFLQSALESDLAAPGDGIVQKADITDFLELFRYLLQLPPPLLDDASGGPFGKTLKVKIALKGQLDLLIGRRRIGGQFRQPRRGVRYGRSQIQ